MLVTVPDRLAFLVEVDLGAAALGWLPVRLVEIDDRCPVCGGPRGRPHRRLLSEHGVSQWVDGWSNPCGHIDSYVGVLVEAGVYDGRQAIRNRLSPFFGRTVAEIVAGAGGFPLAAGQAPRPSAWEDD